MKESWLNHNANWLIAHSDDYNAGVELAHILGIEVHQLPERLDPAELKMILDCELVKLVDKELSQQAMPTNAVHEPTNAVDDQTKPIENGPAKEKRDTRVYYPPFNPYWNY